jgi:hypothetical protein
MDAAQTRGWAGSAPPRKRRGPGHQDHANEKGHQPGGFEQHETRGHADAVAEDNHAEDDPGHRLRRVMPRREVCSGAMLKALCMSHSPIPQVAQQRAGRRTGPRHGAPGRLSGAAHQWAQRRTDTIGAARRARAPGPRSVNAGPWPAGAAPESRPAATTASAAGPHARAATVTGRHRPLGGPGGDQVARVTGAMRWGLPR